MDQASEPLTIEIGGVPITAEMDEWTRVSTAILDRQVSDRSRQEDAQRAAGQVWTAVYWQWHVKHEEECFSFDDARSLLVGGEDYGNLSAEGVRCPDGSFEAYSYEWAS